MIARKAAMVGLSVAGAALVVAGWFVAAMEHSWAVPLIGLAILCIGASMILERS